ncbi:ribosome hibernation-promoting factor, HPF/YfiA family [Microvirga lotononidis]|uniref:Ribosome hibernation promoting factor n=1 Tax=Microvirga lotononidis TaxID=864069 RepID=I4YZ94_9HYPH|nr:ribosome-associated translation inhibitor RaiA [Microvirga lotononidis]EIM29286.1 ribosomal subunit interface protein [Microvirga lotononidis]WQO29113.1 ribosome-associated translation inhibitor RaiA [Microvirga lotononidis]
MTLRVSGKNLDIGEALRSQVQDRVAGALSKYFDGGYSGHVTVTRDGTGYRTDCVLHLTSGMTLEASGAAPDAYASFDQTAGRLENRLRRYKQRLKGRSGPPTGRAGNGLEVAYSVLEAPGDDWIEEESYHPMVIAETTKPLHRLSVSDAVMQLDLTGAAALVFIHASTGRTNVVYRRGDGAIGWVDPPLPQP